MGAHQLFDITFNDKANRLQFEQLMKKRYISCRIICCHVDEPDLAMEAVYDMGYLGYAEPEMILKDCKKQGIQIKFFAWIPICDRGAKWEKLKGRW